MDDRVYCYGCGDDITAKCTNRYNMTSSSCARAVPIWKKKFNDVIHSKRLNINIDELLKADLSGGRMCRPCVSAFERLDKLERSVISNLTNALDSIVSGPISRVCRKRTREGELTSSYPCTTGLNFASSQDVVSPDVAVVVNNPKQQKTYFLTPKRKRLGKAVARRSCMAMAEECLKNSAVMQYLLVKIGKKIRTELRSMCSNTNPSVLRSQSPNDLIDFQWMKLHKELQERAPTFLMIFMASTKTRTPRHNQTAIVGVCTAILLKHRFQHMSQKLIGLILYGMNSQKMVFQRLSVIGLCVSHKTVTKLVERISHGHDKVVKLWTDNCNLQLTKMNDILQSVTHGYNDSEVESISSSSTDSEDSDYVHAMDESESDESLKHV